MKKILTWFAFTMTLICVGVSASIVNVEAEVADSVRWELYQTSHNDTKQTFALGDPLTAGQPFTVTSRVQLKADFNENASEANEIWLAGVSGAASTKPTLLALVWAPDTSSWFPVWSLYLHSEAGILPLGEKRRLLATIDKPQNNGEYSTMLSYDPKHGAISVKVVAQPGNKELYAGNLDVGPYSGVLYPGTGIQIPIDDGSTTLKVDKLVTQPLFVPVGAKAKLVARGSADDPFVAMAVFNRRDEWALQLDLPNYTLEHQLRLVRDDGKMQSVHLNLTKTASNQTVPVPSSSIMAGKADYVLEYVAEGDKWELARLPVQVGSIDIRLESAALTVSGNGKPELIGYMRVSADGDIPTFTTRVGYDLSVHSKTTPLYEQWIKTKGSIELPVAGIGTNITAVAFRIPLDSLNINLDDEVFARFTFTSDLDVRVVTDDLNGVVLGQRVPAFPKVGEYSVLRGDFHSHTTESDGEIRPQERIWESYMYGYDVVAITDHGNFNAYDNSGDFAKAIGLTLLRGFETGIEGKQHLVVLGIDTDYKPRDEHQWSRQTNKSQVFYQDQVQEVIAHGGYILYAHPGGMWIPPGPYTHPDGVHGLTDEMLWMLEKGYIDGVELPKWLTDMPRRDAIWRWAQDYDLTLFDNSDIHTPRDFTGTGNAPVTLVLAKANTPEGVLEALRDKRTLIWSNGQLRGMEVLLKLFMNSIVNCQNEERNGQPGLQITNKGPLGFYGKVQINVGVNKFAFIPPKSSVWLPADTTGSVEITWSNILVGPGSQAFTMQYDVIRH